MDDSVKVLNLRQAESVLGLAKSLLDSYGETGVSVFSWWSMGQRWARNKPSLTSDQRDVRVRITRWRGASATVVTNQIDDKSISAACKLADFYSRKYSGKEIFIDLIQYPPTYDSKGLPVWSESTFNRAAKSNADIVHSVSEEALAKGFLSAGYIENSASTVLRYERDQWGKEYTTSGQVTQAHCSMTIREPKGNGSGWAGGVSFDIDRLEPKRIASIAFEKCTLSLNAVRIEPGRYQTILEPQASSFFFKSMLAGLDRSAPERGLPTETYLETDPSIMRHRSKLGLKIVDERITIRHDPTDSLVGTHIQSGVESIVLIEDGILKNLWDRYPSTLKELVQKEVATYRSSFRVNGTNTPVEEMVSTMKRGLLVTRISDPIGAGNLYTGTTRDGLWLIENGKITKAVRNFRWTESPWFVLNNVEQLGQSIPVFEPANMRNSLENSYASALRSIVAPWIKINDFSFTSTVDAI